MTDPIDIESIVRKPAFSSDQVAGHQALLSDKVFQTKTKWPHFNLLLSDISELAQGLTDSSTVVSLERGLLYGGISLLAPFFSGKGIIPVDCSPQSADARGAYNKAMVADDRICAVESSLRADINETGLPDEIADLVIVPNLVHHIADQNTLFAEITRLVKPGGSAYVFEPLVRELHQIPDDFLRYTPFGIRRTMEQHGLKDCIEKTEGGAFSAVAYCWAQALEYFPDEKRAEMSEWFYNTQFPQLMEWDEKYPENQVRDHTSFPMAFSVCGKKSA